MTSRGNFEVAVNREAFSMKLHGRRYRHQVDRWRWGGLLRPDNDRRHHQDQQKREVVFDFHYLSFMCLVVAYFKVNL
jgi:hypothetical protein